METKGDSGQRELLQGASGTTATKGGTQPADAQLATSRVLQQTAETLDLETLSRVAASSPVISAAHLELARTLSPSTRAKWLLDLLLGLPPGRANLGRNTSVQWDDHATLYEATSVAHGHVLHFKQVWRADGYSLGDLVQSLPLAPGQKKQVAVIDWKRRETGTRRDSLEDEERLDALQGRDRDIGEVIGSALREHVAGGSTANTWGVGGGTGAAGSGTYSGFSLGAVLGVSGGGGGGSSNAWQDSSRDLAGNALQSLRDRIQQAASVVRGQRSSVVATVDAGESVSVSTEVVANHNHCHAVTVEYFQVLRHLVISQDIVDVQECLFVPLPMSLFDAAKVVRWRDAISANLLDRSLLPAIEATKRVDDNWLDTDLPAGTYADEEMLFVDGELRISFNVARPPKPDEHSGDDFWTGNGPWGFVGTLLGNPQALFNQVNGVANGVESNLDQIWEEKIAPKLVPHFISALQFSYVVRTAGGGTTSVPAQFDCTLVSDYASNVPLYVRLTGRPGTWPMRSAVVGITVRNIVPLSPQSRTIITSLNLRYRTRHITHTLARNDRIDDEISAGGNDTYVDAPLDDVELRDPRSDDRRLQRRLLDHLNNHLEQYHKIIWWSMDPDRRYMLLDGFIAPNSGGRSIASVVENRLIGIIGNSLVLPVARGNRLDPTYVVGTDADGAALLRHYQPNTPVPPMRVALPTSGVYAEAVMGRCNSCEEKDERLFWRWEESPIDEPTPISGVTPPVVATSPPLDTTPTPLPAPVVAFQNVPAAPDPTGLGQALQVLGNANVFRDLTGLDANQRNALAAYTASLQTAQAFGQEASKLVQQQVDHQQSLAQQTNGQRNLQAIRQSRDAGLINGDQANNLAEGALRGMAGTNGRPSASDLQQIARAHDAGLITTGQAADLTHTALQNLVGGQAEPTPLTDKPAVQSLLTSASSSGKDVTVSQGGDSISLTSPTDPPAPPPVTGSGSGAETGTSGGTGSTTDSGTSGGTTESDPPAPPPVVPLDATGLPTGAPGMPAADGSSLPSFLEAALVAKLTENIGRVVVQFDYWLVTEPADYFGPYPAGQLLLFSVVKLMQRLTGAPTEQIVSAAHSLQDLHALGVYGAGNVPLNPAHDVVGAKIDYDAVETLRVALAHGWTDAAQADLDDLERYLFFDRALSYLAAQVDDLTPALTPSLLARYGVTANYVLAVLQSASSRSAVADTWRRGTNESYFALTPLLRVFDAHRVQPPERLDRELPYSDYMAVPIAQYADMLVRVCGLLRRTARDQQAQAAAEAASLDASARNKPQPLDVPRAAAVKFILTTYQPDPTRPDSVCRINLAGPVDVHGGHIVTNPAGDGLFILEAHTGGVTFQNQRDQRFYTQTATGLEEDLRAATLHLAGQQALPVVTATDWLLEVFGALFPATEPVVGAATVLRRAAILFANRQKLLDAYATLRTSVPFLLTTYPDVFEGQLRDRLTAARSHPELAGSQVQSSLTDWVSTGIVIAGNVVGFLSGESTIGMTVRDIAVALVRAGANPSSSSVDWNDVRRRLGRELTAAALSRSADLERVLSASSDDGLIRTYRELDATVVAIQRLVGVLQQL